MSEQVPLRDVLRCSKHGKFWMRVGFGSLIKRKLRCGTLSNNSRYQFLRKAPQSWLTSSWKRFYLDWSQSEKQKKTTWMTEINLPISLIIKLSGLRRKWRLQASLITSTSSCGPLISNVNGKTQPFSRISLKLSVSLVSIVDLFASLNSWNNSNPLSWCDGLESPLSDESSLRIFSQLCTVDVGRNTIAKTLLRTIEHFGVLSRIDLVFKLIPQKEIWSFLAKWSSGNMNLTWSKHTVISFVIHISVGGLQEPSITERDSSNKCKFSKQRPQWTWTCLAMTKVHRLKTHE